MAATTKTFVGGNLFRIAAEEYGDATLWWVIATANNIADPWLTGTVTLSIPDADPSLSGGLPPDLSS